MNDGAIHLLILNQWMMTTSVRKNMNRDSL